MNWLKSKKTVAVHSGNFHPDDVFSVAFLSVLYHGRIKIIRTREKEVYSKADFVIDVGGEYDPARNRFDHHQIGGAGIRDNKIAYSSFGPLWLKYGEQACGSKEVAHILEKKLVEVIDADDSGFNLCQMTVPGLSPFFLTDVIYSMRPTWKENNLDINKLFLRAVDFARNVITREIKVAQDGVEIARIIQGYYQSSFDKRLIVIDTPKVSRYDVWDALQKFPEPLFVVYGGGDDWSVVAMRKDKNDFSSRKYFPANWSGLRDGELAKVTGVSDAVFCLSGLFLLGTKSKESAIKLAELALKTN